MMYNNGIANDTKQGPYQSPTVFNFYLPDYQDTGVLNSGYTPSRRLPSPELYNPEFEILDAATAITLADRMKGWCRAQWVQIGNLNGLGTMRITFDLERELQMARDDSQSGNDYNNPGHNKGRMKDLLEYYDLLLCNGSLTEGTKEIIYEGLATTNNDGPNQNAGRVEGMLLAILTSPDCAVED
jgi:hypothetical protein